MPSPHSLYNLRAILIVSVYIYMDMYCFGLVREVSGRLRVGPMAADSFGWVVADGFGWLPMVSGGFGWFAVLVFTVCLPLFNFLACLESFNIKKGKDYKKGTTICTLVLN